MIFNFDGFDLILLTDQQAEIQHSSSTQLPPALGLGAATFQGSHENIFYDALQTTSFYC